MSASSLFLAGGLFALLIRRLLAAARSAGDAKAFATVTFIWIDTDGLNGGMNSTRGASFTTPPTSIPNSAPAWPGPPLCNCGTHPPGNLRRAHTRCRTRGHRLQMTEEKQPGAHPAMHAQFPRLNLPAVACALCVLSTGLHALGAEVSPQDANLQFGAPFADNAVFQQGIPLPIWGTARPGAEIEATFAGQTKTATANADGAWRVTLDPLKATQLKSVNDAPEGHALKITSTREGNQVMRELGNIAIGDVWLCAGQSNIAGGIRTPVNTKNHPPDTVAAANYPGLRFLNVEKQAWDVCTPETVLGCSRVAFFFARRVQRDALVPVGLIVRAVGGSNIESWLNQEPYPVGGNYARLMTPVVGYGIRGAIWYQGESNEKDGLAYRPKLEALITGWRKAWEQGDFPFHFVQLPGINASTTDNPAMGDGRAAIRQAFFETLALPNTGMAVTIDVGTKGEHPPNKFDTAERLARSVLRKVYGLENITACPLYKRHKVEGNSIRISFTDDAQNGLMIAKKADTLPEGFLPPVPAPDAKLQWLSIQDEGGQWYWADAKIDGAELVVSADGVAKPIAVRYAYTTQPLGHLLYNKDGMPVGPFSTSGHDEAADAKPQTQKP